MKKPLFFVQKCSFVKITKINEKMKNDYLYNNIYRTYSGTKTLIKNIYGCTINLNIVHFSIFQLLFLVFPY